MRWTEPRVGGDTSRPLFHGVGIVQRLCSRHGCKLWVSLNGGHVPLRLFDRGLGDSRTLSNALDGTRSVGAPPIIAASVT